MSYEFSIERGDQNWYELEPNYKRHYQETKERYERDGVTKISPYNPRLDIYFDAFATGRLINFVVRKDGEAVGHANVWLSNDMHNGDLIAQEDMIYMHPDHRKGHGRKLTLFVLEYLKSLGVKRAYIDAVTDLRAEKLWQRIGFTPAAQKMIYTF